MAERSLDRQAEQNEIIAEQSREVTQNTGDMLDAEAVARAELIRIQQDLVERDAQGRQDLTEVQRETHADY